MIKIKKPKLRNNELAGYRIVEVSEELVKKQLGLPEHKRNPHFRGIEIIEDATTPTTPVRESDTTTNSQNSGNSRSKKGDKK